MASWSESARVWIGWDPTEIVPWVVAERSLRRQTGGRLYGRRLALLELRAQGLYRRPTEYRTIGQRQQLWDVLSAAPMSTEHAISRFFIPHLCGHRGWALFVDGDVLFRASAWDLFDLADARYAVQVVQHPQFPAEGTKKDGAPQLAYPRKNWSSVMLWNCAHPAHEALTLDVLNTWPGRDLHAFAWLADDLIGALPSGWNYLVHLSPPTTVHLVHYTLGTPNLPGHETDPFAEEWWAVAQRAGYTREPGRVSV